jgi:uncharacterized protein
VVREEHEQPLEMDRYTVSEPRAALRLRTGGALPQDELKLGEPGGRAYGIMMHDLLSRIVTTADIEPAVDRACAGGLLQADRRSATVTHLHQLLSSDTVRPWFDGTATVMTEASVILPSGAARRPDRVMISDGKVTVVDYKFGEPSPRHRQQAAAYREILSQMGYAGVRSWLWYVEKNHYRGGMTTGQVTYEWGTTRRFNSYADWFARLFGGRVQKVSINAGFTCPNRDGTLGTGGCTYCNNEAFIPAYCTPEKSVTEQIEQGIAFHRHRYRRAANYIAYFQAYTNTYAGTERLISLYDEALNHPAVTGIVIGTRPDCVSAELLDRLAVMARDYFIMIEYGIESVHDETLKRINRGHDYASAEKAVRETAARGLNVGAHLIFGLPGENRSMLEESAEIISSLPLTSIKIRQLQLIRGTVMAEEYKMNPGDFELYLPRGVP